MKTSLYVRELNENERSALKSKLQSRDAFEMRRSQIILASARREKPSQIAQAVGCTAQTVRNIIHAFERQGLLCLSAGSNRPVSVVPVLDVSKRGQLQVILHQSPRLYGKAQSVWTLKLLAQVCHEQGLSDQVLSAPTLLDAIVRLGCRWQRAKQWIVSPDPLYALKKVNVTALST